MLTMLDDKVFSFRGSVLGFGEMDQFRFSVVDEKGIYGYLQSEEVEHLSFLVIDPFVFHPEYSFEIEDSIKEALAIQSHEEVVVLAIVTIQNPFDQSTANLLAPLILSLKNGYGRQIVLPPKCNYSTKVPLFNTKQIESGD